MEDDHLQDGRVLPKSLCSLDRNGNSFKSGGSRTPDKYINHQSRLRNVKSGWEGYIYPTLGLQRAQYGRKNGR